MILPDIILINTLNLALAAVRADYIARQSASQVERSFLYLCFNDLRLDNYIFFDELKALIMTTKENPKHLHITSNYDKNSNKAPFIFVTLGGENDKNNTLNIGIGDNDELLFDNPEEADESKSQYSRRYGTVYHIVIGSENKTEVIVLYNLFKALMIVCINHLSIEGIENLKIGGQDLRNNIGIPDSVFMRNISITFEYNQVVPDLAFQEIIRKIRLYWRPEGAIASQGPIEISVADDINGSSS